MFYMGLVDPFQAKLFDQARYMDKPGRMSVGKLSSSASTKRLSVSTVHFIVYAL